MSPPLLWLVHGWAFDASVWRELAASLAPWPMQAFDAGYFAESHDPAPAGPHIAVGHSLGAMRCLETLSPECRGLVLINGFTRFTAAPDFPEGVPLRLLDRMLSRMDADAARVLGDFRQRCGAASWPMQAGGDDAEGIARPSIDTEALTADLRFLRDGDVRARFAGLDVPVMVLAGSADPIVAPALTEASFEASRHCAVHWCEGGGHLLPMTHADWCASRIRRFIADLEGDVPEQALTRHA